MSRSLKKLPFVDEKLLKKIEEANKNQIKGSFKTWSRCSVITPEMIGHKLLIHNGKKFVSREVTQEMIGYKMGVFSPTRQLGSHGKAGKR